jgi:hypothetical protein
MHRIGWENCPYCHSSNVYASRPRSLWEELAILFLLRPVRCHYCKLRYYRPLFLPTMQPHARTMDSKKPARAGSANRDEQRSA